MQFYPYKRKDQIVELDQESVSNFINADVANITDPTSAVRVFLRDHDKRNGREHFDSDVYLETVVAYRHHLLKEFLHNVARAVAESGLFLCSTPLEFRLLGDDSHNGAAYPLVLEDDDGKSLVLKFADPRPYKLLDDIISLLSRDTGVCATGLQVIGGPEYQHFFAPYLKENNETYSLSEIENFMYILGSLTAVAYCLRMVDLHLENIIAHDKRPIIVDPECVLYHFGDSDVFERLLNTGFVSHNTYFSSIR